MIKSRKMGKQLDRLRTAAMHLVRSHRRVEPLLEKALFYPDPNGQEVRLLEVVKNSPYAGQVYPFRFAANPELGYPFPVVLIELSPKEFRQLGKKDGAGSLALPPGWETPVQLFPS